MQTYHRKPAECCCTRPAYSASADACHTASSAEQPQEPPIAPAVEQPQKPPAAPAKVEPKKEEKKVVDHDLEKKKKWNALCKKEKEDKKKKAEENAKTKLDN